MNNKDNIKIALLTVIALTLIVNTFRQSGDSSSISTEIDSNIASAPATSTPYSPPTPVSNLAANSQMNPIANTPPPSMSESRPKTTVQFKEDLFSFGNIKQDSENKHIFSFTNTGKEPLIIENAVGSCGCTVPTYPKEPVLPGKTGVIEVVYKPGKQKGDQTKTVTITANTEPTTIRLQIKANVEEVVGATP